MCDIDPLFGDEGVVKLYWVGHLTYILLWETFEGLTNK